MHHKPNQAGTTHSLITEVINYIVAARAYFMLVNGHYTFIRASFPVGGARRIRISECLNSCIALKMKSLICTCFGFLASESHQRLLTSL